MSVRERRNRKTRQAKTPDLLKEQVPQGTFRDEACGCRYVRIRSSERRRLIWWQVVWCPDHVPELER